MPKRSKPDRPAQRASVSLRLGRGVSIDAEARITSAGLLAVGALTSAILLSTAVLVRTAVREAKAPDRRRLPSVDHPRLPAPDA